MRSQDVRISSQQYEAHYFWVICQKRMFLLYPWCQLDIQTLHHCTTTIAQPKGKTEKEKLQIRFYSFYIALNSNEVIGPWASQASQSPHQPSCQCRGANLVPVRPLVHRHFVFFQNFVKSGLVRRFSKGFIYLWQLLPKSKINIAAEEGKTWKKLENPIPFYANSLDIKIHEFQDLSPVPWNRSLFKTSQRSLLKTFPF